MQGGFPIGQPSTNIECGERGGMMPRKEIKIKTESYVHVGDKLVNTRDLNPEQKRKLATWLKCTYLNALYESTVEKYGIKVRIYPAEEQETG